MNAAETLDFSSCKAAEECMEAESESESTPDVFARSGCMQILL